MIKILPMFKIYKLYLKKVANQIVILIYLFPKKHFANFNAVLINNLVSSIRESHTRALARDFQTITYGLVTRLE